MFFKSCDCLKQMNETFSDVLLQALQYIQSQNPEQSNRALLTVHPLIFTWLHSTSSPKGIINWQVQRNKKPNISRQWEIWIQSAADPAIASHCIFYKKGTPVNAEIPTSACELWQQTQKDNSKLPQELQGRNFLCKALPWFTERRLCQWNCSWEVEQMERYQ